MRKRIVGISLISACILAGCANVNITINTNNDEPAQESHVTDESESRARVEGAYGSLSIAVPDNWQYKICDINSTNCFRAISALAWKARMAVFVSTFRITGSIRYAISTARTFWESVTESSSARKMQKTTR